MKDRLIRLIAFVSIVMLISGLYIGCYAQSGGSQKVILDGDELSFENPPVTENGRILVPMRALFEKLGADVEWDNETKTVTATKGETVVIIQIGNTSAYIGDKKVELDASPKTIGDRTFVPLRFVSEAMGCEVQWEETTGIVTIKTEEGSASQKQPLTGTPKASEGLEQRLIGTWWVKDSGLHMVTVISFKSDGTFKQNLAVYSSISNYAETTKGCYKIEGDKINYYSQTYSSAKGYWKNSALPDYKELGNILIEGDLPAKDKTESISFTDDNHVKFGNIEMERSK